MRKVVLFLGDIILLYGSLALTLLVRYGYLDMKLWQEHLAPFSLVFAVWVLVFFINRLYEIRRMKKDFEFYGQLIQNLVINALLAVLIFYTIVGRFSDIRPQTILLILLLIFTALFLLWRKIFYTVISGKALQNNLAIIGISPESLLLAEEIITQPELSYKLQLIVNPDYSEIPEKFQIVNISKDLSDLKNTLIKNKINTVVAVSNPRYSPEVARYLFESINLKIQYFNLTDFYEKITGKIPTTALERNWFLENISQKNNQFFVIAKRLIDIFFASLFGLISLILLPIIALLIKIESKGPLIYKQERVGLANKIFTVYKFRSMVSNAEKDGAQWAQKNDARITKIGKLMRKTRLDEIPQFWNIIIGNMSFVGPRPERPEFVEQLIKEVPYYNERHLVKPGLSGWAQINYPYGASVEDAKQKLQYDLFYIKNQSIALDVSIILKTINTIFNITLGR
ncbi:exopolysaccharide biosynthesis polyprenyl glycosylphosphotransferase [Candidatus Parcubacteria bacterium]|nr:MAG: exopolysaccharide biosynthesis polyprenyl glycosylphosphotransferase [Candidatus Parcubacteria bacterium]